MTSIDMPLRVPISKKPHRHGLAICNYVASTTRTEQHKNWFFYMTSVQGTGYPSTFFYQQKSCKFIQWATIENDDNTFDIWGYIQLRFVVPRSSMIQKFNCKTDIVPTTIKEKIESEFNSLPNLSSLGIENTDVSASASGINLLDETMEIVPLSIKFNDPSTVHKQPTNMLGLQQPKRILPKNTKKIKLFN